MNAIHRLFARLAQLLPADQVDELRESYRADAAADSRESRARTREAQRAALEWQRARTAAAVRQAEATGRYRRATNDERVRLRAEYADLTALFDGIDRSEALLFGWEGE